MKEKAIVIGGGVGPMAGVALHQKIIENTRTDGTDQAHLCVHHFSRSADVGDRTAYLLGKSATNPAAGMAAVMRAARDSLRAAGQQAVAGIPCNTFHAPEIFDPFLDLLRREDVDLPVLHMLAETARFINQVYPRVRKIGLLSTTGTRLTTIYPRLLASRDTMIIQVDEDRQEEVQESIYNRDWGIKAVSPVTARAREQVLNLIRQLVDRGAELVILGCTEIPLAVPERDLWGVPLVDPVTVLARALIREAAPEKLKSL